MKLIEYMPLFLQDVREFQEIFKVEDKELDSLKEQIENVLKEIIVNTAEKYGLDRYEKIYNIQNTTTDIATRRFNILSKINNRLPYSVNWLINKLNNTIGENNYILEVDHNNYTIKIQIISEFKQIAQLLKIDLREQLPANLIINVVLFQKEENIQYVGAFMHIGEYETLTVESEVV